MCGPLLRRSLLYPSARKSAKCRKSAHLPAALIVVPTVFYTGEVGYTGSRGLRGNWRPSVNEPSGRAGIRERRYRRSGNPAQGLPTVPDSGEKKPFLPRSAWERASVGTDGRRFERRAAPALPTVPVSRAARRPFYRRSRIPARGLVSPTRTSGQRLPGARWNRPAPSFA